MDAPKIQISQLLSETTKDCDNIVITVLCLSVTKEIPCPTVLNESTHHLYARSLHRDFVSNFYFSKYHRHKYVFKNQISFWLCYTIKMQFYYKCSIHCSHIFFAKFNPIPCPVESNRFASSPRNPFVPNIFISSLLQYGPVDCIVTSSIFSFFSSKLIVIGLLSGEYLIAFSNIINRSVSKL